MKKAEAALQNLDSLIRDLSLINSQGPKMISTELKNVTLQSKEREYLKAVATAAADSLFEMRQEIHSKFIDATWAQGSRPGYKPLEDEWTEKQRDQFEKSITPLLKDHNRCLILPKNPQANTKNKKSL